MRKLCVWLCVAVLLVAGCGHKTARPLTIMEKLGRLDESDRERQNLIGPVREESSRAVVLEVRKGKVSEAGWRQTWIRRYRRNGKFAENIVRNSSPYDANGRYSRVVNKWNADGTAGEQLCYGRDSKLNGRTATTYDRRGRIIEIDHYRPAGLLDSKELSHYDRDGRKAGQLAYRPDGSVLWKAIRAYETGGAERVSRYGPNGKLETVGVSTPLTRSNGFETANYDANGKLSFRWAGRFDARWNVVEFVWRDPKGKLTSKQAWSRDATGNVLMQTEWNPDGSIKLKETSKYTFDSRGNWTKRMVYRQVTKNGKPDLEPYEVEYRTITYY